MNLENNHVQIYAGSPGTKRKKRSFYKDLANWQLYLMMLLPVVYVIIFHYLPMYGIVIAFQNYSPLKGIMDSTWVGFTHFNRFFHSYQFLKILKNTLIISFYSLIAGFPFPIILALSLNYIENKTFKKTVQMTTYAPHFISTVVMVGILTQMLSMRTGFINNVIELVGGQRIDFLGIDTLFRHIYVWSGVWQNAGWGSIVYIAALAGVDPQLHEAAIIDGANKLKRVWHIDLPSILPTIVITLIMNLGGILNVGFQKVFLLQNNINRDAAEVIDTYVYNVGINSGLPNFSYATAISLTKSVVSLILIFIVNRIARKVSETSLW